MSSTANRGDACSAGCDALATTPDSGSGVGADGAPDQSADSTGGEMVVDDLPPVAKLRYQTHEPRDDADYPYTSDVPAPDGPPPGQAVYLSAEGSSDPEGAAIGYFWNVQDPAGQYLEITPRPDAFRASFTSSRIGPHWVSLTIVEKGGLAQVAQTRLELKVAPRPCARDGVSAPCSDELLVPGGSFVAGSESGVGRPNETPAHAANVAPFFLDRYEVTVGRFRRYIDAYTGELPLPGSGAHPRVPGSGWNPAWAMTLPGSSEQYGFAIAECGGTWTDGVGESEARPITCVSWYEAFALCAWEGKRLPTEAEWEFAAVGGAEQRTYPWGNEPPSIARAVFGCLFDGLPQCADTDLPVVGSLPGSRARWGHLDLAGSVWEWTLDFYKPNYDVGPCDNCSQTATEVIAGRAFRGGDYRFDNTSYLRGAARLGFTGGFPDETRGFRCARSAPE